MSLDVSLDAAITAVRVAGQHQLCVAVPSLADLSDWGWGFTELTASLGFVCHWLGEQLVRYADRQEARDDLTAEAYSQLNDLRVCLNQLEAALHQAGDYARAYSRAAGRIALRTNLDAQQVPSGIAGPPPDPR
jgi:hypothetical protein